jgi:flagellar hook-basal body complex protein FliE
MDNITLQPFNFAKAVTRAGMPQLAQIGNAKQVQKPQGFGEVMSQALRSVSDAQNNASQMQKEVQLDNPTVSLEATMVAMQKSQIGFQAALQVRNRFVQAYSDIMNMQV